MINITVLRDGVARVISLIFHPIFIPFLYGLLAYPSLSRDHLAYHTLILTCFVGIPGVITYASLRRKKEYDWFKVERKDRLMPLAGILAGCFGFMLLESSYIPLELYPAMMLVQVSVITIAALVVTAFWKISLHMLGWGAAMGCSLGYALESPNFWMQLAGIDFQGVESGGVRLLILLIILAVAWARLRLDAHTTDQLWAGLGLGAFLSFATMITIYAN